MTALPWVLLAAVTVIGVVVFSAARRTWLRREVALVARAERADQQHRKNHDSVFAELVGSRAERDLLRVRVDELNTRAKAAAREIQDTRKRLEGTTESATAVEARLADAERARVEAAHRVGELERAGKVDAANAER